MIHRRFRRNEMWSLTSVAEISALNKDYGRIAHGTSHTDER